MPFLLHPVVLYKTDFISCKLCLWISVSWFNFFSSCIVLPAKRTACCWWRPTHYADEDTLLSVPWLMKPSWTSLAPILFFLIACGIYLAPHLLTLSLFSYCFFCLSLVSLDGLYVLLTQELCLKPGTPEPVLGCYSLRWSVISARLWTLWEERQILFTFHPHSSLMPSSMVIKMKF